jgi:hypothetical protein
VSKLRIALLDNSQGFFQHALRSAIDAEMVDREWKYAILFMVQAIELALKEALVRAHPLLVFEDVDKRGRTVSLLKAVPRLQSTLGDRIDKKDVDAIASAARWRNDLVHHEFEGDTDHLKSGFGRLMGFYLEFCRELLGHDVAGEVEEVLRKEILEIEGYRNHLSERARLNLDREGITAPNVWECPGCGIEAFVVQGGRNQCIVCGYSERVLACDECGTITFERGFEKVYCGNHKGLDAYRLVCLDCLYRGQEDWEERNAREWYG